MEVGVILATLILLGVLYIVIRLILGPLKILTRLLINSTVALIALIIINFIGGYFSFHIPVNIISVLGIGVLGVPGLILFAFLSFMFVR